MNLRYTEEIFEESNDGKYIYLNADNIIQQDDEMQYKKNGAFYICRKFIGKQAKEVSGFPEIKVRRKI